MDRDDLKVMPIPKTINCECGNVVLLTVYLDDQARVVSEKGKCQMCGLVYGQA